MFKRLLDRLLDRPLGRQLDRRREPKARSRPLTAAERARYAAYFDRDVLDAARVFDGRVPFWLRPSMCGVTLGPRIHFRPGAYNPSTECGIELLGHELAHVQQYRDGMTVLGYLWASRRGYRANPYEVDAYALAAQIRAEVSATLLAERGAWLRSDNG